MSKVSWIHREHIPVVAFDGEIVALFKVETRTEGVIGETDRISYPARGDHIVGDGRCYIVRFLSWQIHQTDRKDLRLDHIVVELS